jgi:DNA polymerase I
MQVNLPETKRIESMVPSMLVSATYDNISKSVVLKFYEPESKKLILWHDETNHKPITSRIVIQGYPQMN